MSIVRFLAALAVTAACLLVTGCGSSASRTFTVSQPGVADRQLMLDEEDLEGLGGVQSVRTQHLGNGTAVLEIIVAEDAAVDVLDRARALGYQPVRN